ncbi:hypothetical protein DXG01_002654 [Tephrocybe rancida]|nr:hypothetical protein DXG01_002654 [Tephrocybe rancida]
MSFLHRRSFAPAVLSSASEDVLQSVPFPPAVENIHVSSQPHIIPLITKNRKTSAGEIIRRVSTLLKKKRQPAFEPLDIRAPPESRWRAINDDSSSPTESDVSFDDIRRPSGLGRAASISSNRSLPPSPFTAIDEESPFHLATKTGRERTRALSSPNPARLTVMSDVNHMPSSISMALRNKDRPPPPMPQEVLIGILSFTPRGAVASHARTSSDWCAAARSVFYEALDLRTLRPKQVELLVTLLAYRHDLTDMVRSLECHVWPDFFPPQQSATNGTHSQHPSFSPALTAVFTIAFQNMHLITSVVLPSFDHTFLRHHSAFGLGKLTILSHTMSLNETTQLFAWLDGQTNITELAFPNLLDSNNTPPESSLTIPRTSQFPNNILADSSNTYDASTPLITPSGSPSSPFALLTPTIPVSPFFSLSLLPALTTLVATPSIITSLATTRHIATPRPLQRVTLTINSTLYTGLRPAALLSPLHGIHTLTLKFSSAVDRRTIGKILSAGAALIVPPPTESSTPSVTETVDSTSSHSKALLRNLELQISEQADGADLALYKTISSSISRYQGLVGITCRYAPVLSSELSRTEPVRLTDRENAQIMTWTKHCPSLRSITLLSGAKWERVEEIK